MVEGLSPSVPILEDCVEAENMPHIEKTHWESLILKCTENYFNIIFIFNLSLVSNEELIASYILVSV